MKKKHTSLSVRRPFWFVALSVILPQLLLSCYNYGQQTPDAWNLTQRQLDSISFYTTHHYTQNYNFVVTTDTLPLIVQNPLETSADLPVDTLYVVGNNHLVVADILTVPHDTLDSVWVRVARDQATIGWIHESDLLHGVSPDDPVSRFIDFFSDSHQLILLAIVVMVAVAYVLWQLLRRNAKLVHVNDVDSFYPSMLCLLVALSAVLYATIQLYYPESWRHFYYHPTLNPFQLPFHLSLFILSVWAIVIVSIAVADDVLRLLPIDECVLYFLGLAGVCAVNYIVFSVTTPYFVGYPLFLVYALLAIHVYRHRSAASFECGHCGARLRSKGRCPHCGVVNE